MTHFSTTDLGLDTKIKFVDIQGQIYIWWDKEDPELIEAGINDFSPKDWTDFINMLESQGQIEDLVQHPFAKEST